MANLSLLKQDSTGVVYADPAKPDFTVRFKNTTAAKTLNGQNTKNYLCEIIANDNNTVTVGGTSVIDAVSVRIRISGAAESGTRLASIMASLAALTGTWNTQKVFQGFTPTTPPTVPV